MDKPWIVKPNATEWNNRLLESGGIDPPSSASDFKLMDRKVVDTLLALPEHDMFFRVASSWVGYKSVEVAFEVQKRETGESK